MARTRALLMAFLLMVAFVAASGQKAVPDHLPELNYPPIARAAKVQGDVLVSFRVTADGETTDVSAISGPKMLQGIAIDNVKAWHFKLPDTISGHVQKATFHFSLEPPADGYDEGQPVTKVEMTGDGHISVFSAATTGLNCSECPSA